MTAGRRYIAPTPTRTGTPHSQPKPADMVPGYTLDANLEWNPPQFIDATAYVPTGSVRALDCIAITIAVTDEARP
jgi:hypothetical protein